MSSETSFQAILVLAFSKHILPLVLNRGMLELETLIQTIHALTFRVQKKVGPGTETALVWLLQKPNHPFPPVFRLKPQSKK